MVAAESTSDTQMVTPLPSQFLVAFSAPTIELLKSKKKKKSQQVWLSLNIVF